MIYSISYATKGFRRQQYVHALTAKAIGGADKVYCYGPEDLDSAFTQRHAAILGEVRGAGYWIWKPYICLKTLETIPEGSYLFDCDAGSYFVNRIKRLILFMEQENVSLLPFSVGIPEHFSVPL